MIRIGSLGLGSSLRRLSSRRNHSGVAGRDDISMRNSLVAEPVTTLLEKIGNDNKGRSEGKPNKSKPLSWYSCGPTVYDASHLGHARTYVCTDIIRRILSQHFNLSVDFALGITDVDDKIINKYVLKLS